VDPSGYKYGPSDYEREIINGEHTYYNGEMAWKMNGMMGRPEFSSPWDDYYASQSWSYNWATGQYENSYSGSSMSASAFGASIAPSLGTMLISPEAVATSISSESNIRIGPLTYILDGKVSVSGISFVIDEVPHHFYFGRSDPADLSGQYYHAALMEALFSAKRGQSLEEIIDLNSLGRNFEKSGYNSWSEAGYIQKKIKSRAVIRIYPQSSTTGFRDLQLITNSGTFLTYKGMDLSQIPQIETGYLSSYKDYPYKLAARFFVYDLSGNNNKLLNLINISFYNYQTLMTFFNIYAK